MNRTIPVPKIREYVARLKDNTAFLAIGGELEARFQAIESRLLALADPYAVMSAQGELRELKWVLENLFNRKPGAKNE